MMGVDEKQALDKEFQNTLELRGVGDPSGSVHVRCVGDGGPAVARAWATRSTSLAWACSADAIYVEGADNKEGAQFSPGERYGKVYQINYLRCIFCGLCTEACPTRALTMTNEYELADNTRGKLIFEKDDLLGPLRAGMVPPPHPMYPNTDDGNYYRGEVTESHPSQGVAKND